MRQWIAGLLLIACLAGCGKSPTALPTKPPTSAPPLATASAARTPSAVPPTLSPTRAPTDAPFPRPARWWDETVFYEAFVRSFYDSDGDGIGDLAGLIQKLDYLNDGDPQTGDDLGVTGLWLMPLFPAASYHGYDVTDYSDVNPDYGTQAAFRHLIEEAHQRGIRVIIDLVLNHTSDRHPWFQESAVGPNAPRRDWYVWSDTDPGYLGPDGQRVWHPLNDAYYYGLFWGGMPDLNLENPEVTAELYQIARFWLEEMGADGFRLDAVRHLVEEGKVQAHTPETHAWLRDFSVYVKGVNAEMLTVGEIWDVSDVVAPYVGDELDLAFEFSLAKAILVSVNEGRATPLQSAMKELARLYPQRGYATFLTNHDQNRVMDQFSGDAQKAKLAATVLLTLPGVPFVYYGEEIGMTGSKPDEKIRTPMQWTAGPQAGFSGGEPWQPVNADQDMRNVQDQLGQPDSLWRHYQALIALRRQHPALSVGEFTEVQSASSRVFAFLRTTPDEQFLVVLNLDDKPAADYGLTLRKGLLAPGDYVVIDLWTGDRAAPLSIPVEGTPAGYLPWSEIPERTGWVLQLRSDSP